MIHLEPFFFLVFREDVSILKGFKFTLLGLKTSSELSIEFISFVGFIDMFLFFPSLISLDIWTFYGAPSIVIQLDIRKYSSLIHHTLCI